MAHSDKRGVENSAEANRGALDLGVAAWKKKARPTVRKAPSPRPDELKERRRSMFLKKVREGREDKWFEARSDDMMRLDFVQKQKAWEAERARDAPSLPFEMVEEEEDEIFLPTSNSGSNGLQIPSPANQQTLLDDEIDDLIRREVEEVQALLAYIPSTEDEERNDARTDHLWSDDDDYDALFSEMLKQEEHPSQHELHLEPPCFGDEMDMDLS